MVISLKKSGKGKCSFVAFGRDEATRTPDPYVPNVVRYQLRYIPILIVQLWCKPNAKSLLYAEVPPTIAIDF